MTKSASREPVLKDLSGASYDDLAVLVTRIAESGRVSVEAINGELENIRETTGEKGRAAAETGALEPERHELSPEQASILLRTLRARFENKKNMEKGYLEREWNEIQAKLEANPEKLWSLNEMERTGGEPDLVDFDDTTGEYIFYDCSAESPTGRRNCVYDRDAEKRLKKRHPEKEYNGNAVDMAAAMGIEILDPLQYRDKLQRLGEFDLNTHNWIKTPVHVRETNNAYYGSNSYHRAFVGKQWYYVDDPLISTGFRGLLRV